MAKVTRITGVRKELFRDPQLARFQNSVVSATQQAVLCPLVSGVLLKNQPVVGSGSVNIPHTLGRPFVGYIVTAFHNATPNGISLTTAQPNTAAYIALTATSNGTIDLYVF